ncbi:hypothetical protein FQH17_03210 [Escherichia coli]|uniref:Uncharacterized protein n=1 Tax=Escherichia coli TaxID=562 RepID=A0A8S7MZT7_ECOLX|nr:hypothetical protein [Escherichia coli]EFC9668496.1 hypothetical protein [Escherichia coli]EFE8676019.1 hypothetical protein [Escherichia coli]EFN5511490.1 hypothetical protein [Escherichia coli]
MLTNVVMSELVRFRLFHATALKPTHEVGGRGGESTARNDVSLRASGMGTLHSFIFVINCLSYKCLFFERHVVCYME